MSPRTDDFKALRRLVNDSRLRKRWSAAVELAAVAWRDSRAGRLCSAPAAAAKAHTTETHVRMAATLMASAGLWSILLLGLEPAYVAPAIPRALIAEVAILSLIVAGLPGAFSRAWDSSRLARAVTWRRSASRSGPTPSTGQPTS